MHALMLKGPHLRILCLLNSVQQLEPKTNSQAPKGGRLPTTQLNGLDPRPQPQPLVGPRPMKKYTGNGQAPLNKIPTGLVSLDSLSNVIVRVRVVLRAKPSLAGEGNGNLFFSPSPLQERSCCYCYRELVNVFFFILHFLFSAFTIGISGYKEVDVKVIFSFFSDPKCS